MLHIQGAWDARAAKAVEDRLLLLLWLYLGQQLPALQAHADNRSSCFLHFDACSKWTQVPAVALAEACDVCDLLVSNLAGGLDPKTDGFDESLRVCCRQLVLLLVTQAVVHSKDVIETEVLSTAGDTVEQRSAAVWFASCDPANFTLYWTHVSSSSKKQGT